MISLVCLVGATGTGKTDAALALAEAVGGGVVNFDSRQVYAGLPVVTAQPSPGEQSRCPHLLYGYLPVATPVRAGAFSAELLGAARSLKSRGLTPILVGGTGLYLRALLDGLAPIPDIDPAIRDAVSRECAALGSAALHARLAGLDPDYAARIHPNDPQRICRALEVCAGTGKNMTWWHGQTQAPPDLRVLKLGLRAELDPLTPRLARRIDLMLERGAREEVAAAYASCPDRNAPGFSGIGCPELLSVLLDGADMEDAKLRWLRNTRAYAKRQLTWFRADKRIVWCEPSDTKTMTAHVRTFLAAGE